MDGPLHSMHGKRILVESHMCHGTAWSQCGTIIAMASDKMCSDSG